MMNITDLYSIFNQHPKICTDSRKTIKNSIFFALNGKNFNGNKYALAALKNGCTYAVIDDKNYSNHNKTILVTNVLETLQNLATYHRKQLTIPIIGITGSNGKTTSKELINTVLNTKLKTFATEGNLNNHIGVPLSILSINKQTDIGIIEMGANHQHEIEFLCKIAQPTHAVITNIGSAHLKGFGDLKGVEKTKNELYQYVSKNNGHIFVNISDKRLLRLARGINQTSYGEKGNTHAELVSTTPFININYKKEVIKSKLLGNYQFDNIMLSICIGNHFNISLNNIKQAIESYIPQNNRAQIIDTKNNKLILDAYNANPSSMIAMLDSFAEQIYDNKTCILGEMLELGDHSEYEHKKIISLCKKLKFECYFIGNEFKKINDKSFINKTDFETYLKSNPITEKTILLKGSRSVKLEELITLL